MSTCTVGDCGNATNDLVCRYCLRDLTKHLGDMPALVAHLADTYSRQDRISHGSSGARLERAEDVGEAMPDNYITGEALSLPVHLGASAVAELAHSTLAVWVRTRVESTGYADWPANTIPAMALWLLRSVEWVRSDVEGPQFCDEIAYLARSIERMIDRPSTRRFAGQCGADVEGQPCEADLYALDEATSITCDGWRSDGPGCGTMHSLAERKVTLEARMADRLLPLPLILAALPTLIKVEIPPVAARKWRARGRLVARGVDSLGRELFLGRDVLNLAYDEARRPGRKRLDARRMSA